jgi:RHS repeat-associated protein
MDDIGIIHMDGRLYDPQIGRFLQGDPIIQAMDELQNYNRYAYCISNPMSCTDPSGFSFFSRLFKIVPPWKWPGRRSAIALRCGKRCRHRRDLRVRVRCGGHRHAQRRQRQLLAIETRSRGSGHARTGADGLHFDDHLLGKP